MLIKQGEKYYIYIRLGPIYLNLFIQSFDMLIPDVCYQYSFIYNFNVSKYQRNL